MNKKLIVLFSRMFLSLTALDIGTTYVGLRYRGGVEANVFTDTRTLWAIVWPELCLFLLGAAAVAVGARWGGKRLQPACGQTFEAFLSAFWSARQLPSSVLIFLPLAIACGRVFPVVSNGVFLVSGWSLYGGVRNALSGAFGWSLFRASVMANGLLLGALAVPVTYVIYRVCRSAGRGDGRGHTDSTE